jgi:serine/threonine protein kinase
MVAGKKPFEGKSPASLTAKILESDLLTIVLQQPMTPAALHQLVRTCLAKDPDSRLQSAQDIKLELEWIHDAAAELPQSVAVTTSYRDGHFSSDGHWVAYVSDESGQRSLRRIILAGGADEPAAGFRQWQYQCPVGAGWKTLLHWFGWKADGSEAQPGIPSPGGRADEPFSSARDYLLAFA